LPDPPEFCCQPLPGSDWRPIKMPQPEQRGYSG
jgi:hypothetical protein